MTTANVTIIFTITPEEATRMQQAVATVLKDVGVIDINILVYLALNELTLGRTISHSPELSMDTKIPTIFMQYTPAQHQTIKLAVQHVASYLYKAFYHHLDAAFISTPAQIVQAGLQQQTVNVVFNSHEEKRPWDWQYSISPQ